MKESEIQKIPMEQIFKELGLAVQGIDIRMSIKNKSKNLESLDEQARQEFGVTLSDVQRKNPLEYRKKVIDFFVKNAKDIDKTNLIILMLENYKQTIKTNRFSSENLEKINGYIEKASKMLKGIDKKLYRLIPNEDGTIQIEAISAKKLVGENEKSDGNRRIQELEEKYNIILGEVLNSIILTDLGEVVCDQVLGESIRIQSIYNTAIKKGMDPATIQADEMSPEIERKIKFSELLPNIEEAIKQNEDNINLEKLVLSCAYRYIEFLEERGNIEDKKNVGEIIDRLQRMYKYLEDKTVRIEGRIEEPQYDGYKEDFKYKQVLYRVRDLKKDLDKIEGGIYWGKAQIEETRSNLLQGEVSLLDIPEGRINLTNEERKFLATIDDKNYIYLVKTGKLRPEDIAQINSVKANISKDCLKLLLEKEMISQEDLINLHIQAKVNIEDLDIDFTESLTAKRIYEEYARKDNEEGQAKITSLYKRFFLEGKSKEELEQEKEKIYDVYLQTMNSRYLEIFTNIGTLEISDLDGVMSGKEWINALENGEISEDFFAKLLEKDYINAEDMKKSKKNIALQLKLWEDGKIPSEKIKSLGISFDEFMEMCDQGKIKGTKIGEVLTNEEFLKYSREIYSNFNYGMYNTIRPALSAYNSDMINRDKTIDLIKGMRVSPSQLIQFLEEGLIKGEKIAELRYKGIITKKQFKTLKDEGLVTDEEEVKVANNLTPEEMLKELESNGCEKITNMEEILKGLVLNTKRKHHEPKPSIKSEKKTINPISRDEILTLLGKDVTVTTPKDGFKGYQTYLIPKLGIAVLERMFRKGRTGEPKLSYGDATYICEIGKYIQVSGQSKQEIKQFMNIEGSSNGRVKIINHSSGWGYNLLKAIEEVNPNITINRQKDEVTSISREDNPIDINVKELNRIMELMKKGEFSISLEEYEI